MRLLLASSEVHPYSKSGGLADMVAALAKALARAGHQVGLVTPMHRGIRGRFLSRPDESDPVMIGIAPQKDHAAGDHFLRVDIRDLKAHHLGVETGRAFDVAHIQHDVS